LYWAKSGEEKRINKIKKNWRSTVKIFGKVMKTKCLGKVKKPRQN
jgi:hypothetical protein